MDSTQVALEEGGQFCKRVCAHSWLHQTVRFLLRFPKRFSSLKCHETRALGKQVIAHAMVCYASEGNQMSVSIQVYDEQERGFNHDLIVLACRGHCGKALTRPSFIVLLFKPLYIFYTSSPTKPSILFS